jgi:DNA-binding transcriptional LysR family regulator
MDTKDIRSFMECYETRSINKAARSLYITPQGLVKILDRLEQETRLPLFLRTARGLEPTEAGIYFYGKSQKLLDDMNEIESGMESIRRNKNNLRIGYSCGLLRLRQTEAMEHFESDHPEMELSWEEGTNASIKEKLINGKLDIAFVVGRIPAKNMVEREILSRRVCAVIYKGHPFYEKTSITVADLRGQQLITLNENYQLHSNLLSSCEKEGFYPLIRIKTMEANMIYQFAAEKLGIGIDADIHEKETLPAGIRLIPVEGFIPWTGYAAYSKDRENSRDIQDFIDAFNV